MSILNKLTEGIVGRDLRKEGDALLNKWEKTGLLEGISNDVNRQGMARLLENQASQLLKEASTMAGGDVEGFASVAFPLVRRVFGGLLANDIVSVQPMSLPSGLIFFMDFQHNSERLGTEAADSLYGGGVVGSEITGGITIGEESFYNLNNGYSSPTGAAAVTATQVTSGTFGAGGTLDKLCRFDPDFVSGSTIVHVASLPVSKLTGTGLSLNQDNLVSLTVSSSNANGTFASGLTQIRRLTQYSGSTTTNVLVFATGGNLDNATNDIVAAGELAYTFAAVDNFTTGNGNPGSVVGTTDWGLENETAIPEIDISVDSVAVTAVTKKLKAKWTPELGQDLNAYHNLDAEVELTSILSEQIALEIDREILEDLVKGATAGTYYWSRSPGMFLKRDTGAEVGASAAAPDFTGTVSEWYETLAETINDVSAQIHRKTLRGGANFIVVGPEVANILEFTAGFRASVTGDDDRGTVGAVKVGSMSKKWDVYVDPYFPRNVVLVGRKGGSFLESGYVYAPYVPLQVTPTIFGVEDFVPRKGVMTRYAKKMVRPDMYGLVIVRGLLGESGGS
jgi:hypothetical protein